MRLTNMRPAKLLPLLLLAPVLAGCSGQHAFPPPCPDTAILGDAADFSTYRDPSPKGGRDITDLVLQGSITGISGACRWAPHNKVATDVSLGLDIMRGPSTRSQQAELAVFVAVMQGPDILNKQVFRQQIVFPPNADRLRMQSDPVTLTLPNNRDRSSAAYKVLVGFQLTPGQLAENRRHPAH